MLRPPLLFFLLRGGLQRPKAVVPEPFEVHAELGDGLGARAVQALRAAPAFGHEARLLQDTQVLRDRRPGDLETARDVPDRELRRGDQSEDLAPPRFPKRGESVHDIRA